jgi:hypothetical protein
MRFEAASPASTNSGAAKIPSLLLHRAARELKQHLRVMIAAAAKD